MSRSLRRAICVVLLSISVFQAADAQPAPPPPGISLPANPPLVPPSLDFLLNQIGLNLQFEPLFGAIDIAPDFPDPFVQEIEVGGPVDATRLGAFAPDEPCAGQTTGAATLSVNLDPSWAGQPVYFWVTSNEDTTLAVYTPAGSWFCGDDELGINPAVGWSSAAAGTYDIWVGVKVALTATATLRISKTEP